MALQIEELGNVQATKEQLVETSYISNHPTLIGTSGHAYYKKSGNFWAYRPAEGKTFYKIKNPLDLDCNVEYSWIKCSYIGMNPAIPKEGKASFNEDINAWEYRPKGKQDVYIVKNDSSFKFKRDEDVNL